MKKISVLFILFLLVGGVLWSMSFLNKEEENSMITENFIFEWLQNENGTIATYIKESDSVDSDLVTGREALSETVGLLMIYALEKNDKELFNKTFNNFKKYFLNNSGFIYWKVDEYGKSDVYANALIDDYRIVQALLLAYDKWENEEYLNSAQLIDGYLVTHNINNEIFTDFYEYKDKDVSNDVNLSYIDAMLMKQIAKKNLSDKTAVKRTINILTDAPLRHGFYPKSYNVKKDTYFFDEEVNIVDQAIIAYHQAKAGERSESFLDFIKTEMRNEEAVFGRYDLETKTPSVDYESPAVYGFLILYCLEIDEQELAETLYKRMKDFQVLDKNNQYYGGYSVYNNDTHIFDNLIPLLAEQRMMKK